MEEQSEPVKTFGHLIDLVEGLTKINAELMKHNKILKKKIELLEFKIQLLERDKANDTQ